MTYVDGFVAAVELGEGDAEVGVGGWELLVEGDGFLEFADCAFPFGHGHEGAGEFVAQMTQLLKNAASDFGIGGERCHRHQADNRDIWEAIQTLDERYCLGCGKPMFRAFPCNIDLHEARNRLFRHLETCALTYGCPAAKNLFLCRYEAPLPTSPALSRSRAC